MNAYDYRTRLKDELELRQGRNAFYSLRAFARDLGLSPARLSEILAGKKGLSAPAAHDVAQRLELDSDESSLFVLSAEGLHGRSRTSKTSAQAKLKQALELGAHSKQKLTTIVGWSSDAILKMSQRDGFVENTEAIAKALDIPQHFASGALRFLTRLGLLKNVPREKAYIAHRAEGKRLNIDYEQILEQARKSLLAIRRREDLFEHEALLIEDQDLKRAKAVIAKCFSDLRKLESKRKNAKTYFVATQLFCLETKKGK